MVEQRVIQILHTHVDHLLLLPSSQTGLLCTSDVRGSRAILLLLRCEVDILIRREHVVYFKERRAVAMSGQKLQFLCQVSHVLPMHCARHDHQVIVVLLSLAKQSYPSERTPLHLLHKHVSLQYPTRLTLLRLVTHSSYNSNYSSVIISKRRNSLSNTHRPQLVTLQLTSAKFPTQVHSLAVIVLSHSFSHSLAPTALVDKLAVSVEILPLPLKQSSSYFALIPVSIRVSYSALTSLLVLYKVPFVHSAICVLVDSPSFFLVIFQPSSVIVSIR